MSKNKYPLLHTINDPQDLRDVPRAQLRELSDELRAYLLSSVQVELSQAGKSLSIFSNLEQAMRTSTSIKSLYKQ